MGVIHWFGTLPGNWRESFESLNRIVADREKREERGERERESYRGRIPLSVGGHNILVKNGWPVLLAENNARCRAVLMAGEQQSCPGRI